MGSCGTVTTFTSLLYEEIYYGAFRANFSLFQENCFYNILQIR